MKIRYYQNIDGWRWLGFILAMVSAFLLSSGQSEIQWLGWAVAIPVLKNTQGVIVNNASVLGWRAQAGQSHYAAAKAGVMALTRCVALETVDHGIRINAVAPSLAMNPHLSKTSSNELIAELESKEHCGRRRRPRYPRPRRRKRRRRPHRSRRKRKSRVSWARSSA